MNLRLKSVGDTISKNPLLQLVSEYPSYRNNLLISRSRLLLQLLYYSFSSLCNFDPISNIVTYFFLVLNFATVICVLSTNVKLYFKKKLNKINKIQSQKNKKRVPGIWFVRKIWDFLVARGQKIGTRSHRDLLEHSPAVGTFFHVFVGQLKGTVSRPFCLFWQTFPPN